MTKNEFLKLFELEKLYEENQKGNGFALGLFDRITGTETQVFYIFEGMKDFKLQIEIPEIKGNFEACFLITEEEIKINNNEKIINNFLKILHFKKDIDFELKFLANFINQNLKINYKLVGNITVY